MGRKVGWKPRRRGVMGARHDLRGPAFASFKLRLLLRTWFEKGRERIFERDARHHPFSSNSSTRVPTVFHPIYLAKSRRDAPCATPLAYSLFAKDYRQGITIKLRYDLDRSIDRSIERRRSGRSCRSSTTREEVTMRSNVYSVPSSLTRIPSAW